MDKKVDGNILAVRLYTGEDAIASLQEAFKYTSKPLGIVLSGAGMMRDVRLGYFKGRGQYKENVLTGPGEIVSLTGNFVNDCEKVYTHLHISLADENGKVAGGHLLSGQIYGTGEIFVMLAAMSVIREKEEETGLEGLKL